MNYTTYNNYKLPIMCAKITDATPKEKQEYLRLLNKASGFNRGAFFCDYQGIPYCPEITENYFFSGECHAVNHFQTLLPIQEAITWLKLATGEITADNFAVDVTKPDERLEDFKEWFLKDYVIKSEYDYQFWHVEDGIKGRANIYGSPIIPNIITPTQFFAYLHEDERPEPKAGDWIEATDVRSSTWYKSYKFIGYVSSKGRYVCENTNGDICTWGYIRLPHPDPAELKRKEAERKAKEWLEKSKFVNSYTSSEALTQYIMDQEGEG